KFASAWTGWPKSQRPGRGRVQIDPRSHRLRDRSCPRYRRKTGTRKPGTQWPNDWVIRRACAHYSWIGHLGKTSGAAIGYRFIARPRPSAHLVGELGDDAAVAGIPTARAAHRTSSARTCRLIAIPGSN